MESTDTTDAANRDAELELEDSFVIYDTNNHRAWLQSDEVVDCTAMT